jgi:hypothetical protein
LSAADISDAVAKIDTDAAKAFLPMLTKREEIAQFGVVDQGCADACVLRGSSDVLSKQDSQQLRRQTLAASKAGEATCVSLRCNRRDRVD